MNETETEQQPSWEDLIAFQKSLHRPVPVFRWPYKHSHESRTYRRWRLRASIVHRLKLWADAFPIEFGMTKAYFAAEDAERTAHTAWLKQKHKLEMDFLCGKRRTPTPWGC